MSNVGPRLFVPDMAARPKSLFLGKWRIAEMEQWDRDYVDLDGPGLIKFERGGLGALRFGAVEVGLDCKTQAREGRIEFSFEGYNDADPCSGRGSAEIRDGALYGKIFFHLGDESWFRAVRS